MRKKARKKNKIILPDQKKSAVIKINGNQMMPSLVNMAFDKAAE